MIWLLRHGDAENIAEDDSSRALTRKGERQARAAGAALAVLGVEIDACLSSPKVRAEQTARLACEALGVDVEITDDLRGGDFDAAAVAAGRGNCLLVGHEPDFSRAVAMATGARVVFRKGALAAIDGATLTSLLRPDQIKKLAAS